MSKIISVENISKRYAIGQHHHRGKRTFREAIIQSSHNVGYKFIHPFSKRLNSATPYEEFWALKDINFEVEQGERIGIIGRNGAGKSTLLKILSRITEPTTGKITLKGRVASLLEVGTGFNGELTGRENIYLNGSILGMTRVEIKRKFDEIIDFSGVEKFLDTPVKRYSSGMYVRLAFAVAAHLEPEILVVDEVLAVGDAEFQKKCLGKMQDVSKSEGRTVLFVSHNLSAVKSLCEKAILLESGKIVANNYTIDVINQYQITRENCGDSIRNFENIALPAFFCSLKLMNKDKLTNHFFWDDEIIIIVEFEISAVLTDVYIAAEVCNFEDTPILWMSDIDNANFRERKTGLFNLKFIIPSKLLPQGSYYINIGIIKQKSNPIQSYYQVITLTIEDTSSSLSKKSIKCPALLNVPILSDYIE